jgi:hypothetical protein
MTSFHALLARTQTGMQESAADLMAFVDLSSPGPQMAVCKFHIIFRKTHGLLLSFLDAAR